MKKLSVLVCACLGLFGLMHSSCEYNNEEDLYPVCDTITTPTFQAWVFPIIQSNCTGCHSGSSPEADISLENYDDIKSLTGEYLLCVIEHQDGCEPMPRNADKLSDCDINAINRWIANGLNDD